MLKQAPMKRANTAADILTRAVFTALTVKKGMSTFTLALAFQHCLKSPHRYHLECVLSQLTLSVSQTLHHWLKSAVILPLRYTAHYFALCLNWLRVKSSLGKFTCIIFSKTVGKDFHVNKCFRGLKWETDENEGVEHSRLYLRGVFRQCWNARVSVKVDTPFFTVKAVDTARVRISADVLAGFTGASAKLKPFVMSYNRKKCRNIIIEDF